jgi:capsular polysaccharide biosynthesis protein
MNNRQEEYEIDLLKLIKVLWSKALVIILVALLVGSLVFVYTYMFITPTYTATASFYVNNSSVSLGATRLTINASELSASNNLVYTYVFILKSRTTLEDVIAEANLPYSYGKLGKMLETKAVTNTAAFNVTVTSESPTEAELIANTVAKVLPERISEIVDGSNVRIVDYAIVPAGRSAPSFTKNTAIGCLIGAFLAIAVITVKFLIDEQNDVVIHSADELREMYPDISVLALIPDMRLSEKKGYYYSSYYGKDGKAKEA